MELYEQLYTPTYSHKSSFDGRAHATRYLTQLPSPTCNVSSMPSDYAFSSRALDLQTGTMPAGIVRRELRFYETCTCRLDNTQSMFAILGAVGSEEALG